MDVRAYLALFLGIALLAGSGICNGKDPRALLITVFETGDAELARKLLGSTSVAVGKKPGSHATVRTYGTDSVRPPGNVQQVRVIEGQKAHFSTTTRSPEARLLWAEDRRRGPLANVDLVTQQSRSGFDVQAELRGRKVLLQLDRYNGESPPGYTDSRVQQNISTTVFGSSGIWLDAGGSLALEEAPAVNRSYSLRHNYGKQTRLLIKVELAP